MDFESDPFMNQIEDKPVCLDCLLDKGLKKFFREGYAKRKWDDCAYCDNQNCETISSLSVQSEIRRHCLSYKALANDHLSYITREGGWMGKTYDADDLFQEAEGAVCEPLLEEMRKALSLDGGPFCDKDHHSLSQFDQWKYGWSEFKHTIKHRCRFLFGQIGDLNPDRNHDEPSPEDFLRHYIPTGLDKLNAVKTLKTGTILYRCRITDATETVSEFSHIGPPPPESCLSPNRFSPPGIPMFYAGQTPEIAAKEIGWNSNPGEVLHSGTFETTRELKILDFTALDYPAGNFDPQWEEQYHIARFFEGFIKDLSAPSPDIVRKHIDYIPTQVLCEYFRYFGATLDGEHQQISGIKYPSSHDETPCYVFFGDNCHCSKFINLNSIKSKHSVQEPQ